MKKWLLIILIVAFVIAILYLITPSKHGIENKIGIMVNAKSFSRTILEDSKWKQWWPGKIKEVEGKPIFFFNKFNYTISEKNLNSVVVTISNGSDSFQSELLFIPENRDSVVLTWHSNIDVPGGPAKGLETYFIARQLSKDFEIVLQRIKAFYAKDENIYGIEIRNEFVIDSLLISTSLTTQQYPTTENVYGLISKLENFAKQKNAKLTGLPMLNINRVNSTSFVIKVALPVDKKLPDEGDIVYRWMLGGGNILVAEVKGGPYKINKAFEALENYIRDFNRTAPAIPFQSLVKDRRLETDTSKWITKVYWPVM